MTYHLCMPRRPPNAPLFPYTTLFRSCIGNEWAGDPARGRRPWRDTMVAVTGPAAAALDDAFASIWRRAGARSEEHTSELQSRRDLVCRLLLEKKKKQQHGP